MFDKNDDEIIGYLEDQKAIFWDGVAENGEAIFRFDLERLKEVMPELYTEIMDDMDKELMHLYELGLVELEYDEELNVMFRITDKGKEWADGYNGPFPFPFQD